MMIAMIQDPKFLSGVQFDAIVKSIIGLLIFGLGCFSIFIAFKLADDQDQELTNAIKKAKVGEKVPVSNKRYNLVVVGLIVLGILLTFLGLMFFAYHLAGIANPYYFVNR